MKSVEGGTRFDNSKSVVSFWRRAEWKLVWHLSFCKCSETGKQLWPFTKVYLGKATWMGPGAPAIEERWVSRAGYMFLKLKGKV